MKMEKKGKYDFKKLWAPVYTDLCRVASVHNFTCSFLPHGRTFNLAKKKPYGPIFVNYW